MNKQLLSEVRSALNDFEQASAYDRREIETCMEALASRIYMWQGKSGDEPNSLTDAVEMLPFNKKAKATLEGISDDLNDLMQIADYDSGEDFEDQIEDLKNNFFEVFDEALTKLENKSEKLL